MANDSLRSSGVHTASAIGDSQRRRNALGCEGSMFPQIFGKYVLEREIAAGGMARVFLATLRGAVGFEKRLVVKQIRPELAIDDAFVRRFVEEAKTAVELSHPNIVPVYELGVEQGVYYIAMEHCAGVTLADVLACTGPLDADEGAYLGAEMCRALDYAYRRAGIVHRDVTPRNVLLDDEGGVRLIDFGIAAPVGPTSGRAREVFGSPGHMPPEQLRGDALGPSSDVFAVGVLLIEAWTAVPPFRRGTAEESVRALRSVPPPVDRDRPELAPIAALIRSSIELDPKARPATAEQLGRGLRDFLRGGDAVEVSRRLAQRVRRVRGRSRPDREEDLTDAASEPGRDSTPPLVTPAGATPVTQTFAVRDEMVEWTRKWSSAPPPPAIETRRLSSRPSAPPREPEFAGGAAEKPAKGSPARLLGGLVAGAAVLLGLAFSTQSQPDARTPVVGSAAAPPVVAAVALPSAGAAAVHEPATPLTAAPSAATRGADTAVRAPTRPSAALEPATPGIGASPPSASAATTLAITDSVASLRITADPPAVVTVEGGDVTETRATPVRSLGLRPGVYRVSFRSETYGSPVTTQVTLAPGAVRTVHADFRAAVPIVTVR
jgi:eukaryotic-like serine/threonine-protein kinase